MIEIRSLSLSYGEKRVLENVSLSIPRGAHAALMGPSGCGKTSLLKAVMGLLKPGSGSVEVSGSISCAFQEPRLLPWLSALDNVKLVLGVGDTAPLAMEWLEKLGLAGDAHKLPSGLSGGMQQRLSLARALAHGGDILILDEPLKAMDETLRRSVAELIRSHADGRTLLIATHERAEAEFFGCRVYAYDRGEFHPE